MKDRGIDFLISWNANPASQSVQYYELQRKINSGDWEAIANITYPTTEYLDADLDVKAPAVPGKPTTSLNQGNNSMSFAFNPSSDPSNREKSYRVRAVSTEGIKSEWSPVRSKTPSSGIWRYDIEIKDAETEVVLVSEEIAVADPDNPVFTRPVLGSSVVARVRAIDLAKNKSAWSEWSDPVGPPATPTNLVITEIING